MKGFGLVVTGAASLEFDIWNERESFPYIRPCFSSGEMHRQLWNLEVYDRSW